MKLIAVPRNVFTVLQRFINDFSIILKNHYGISDLEREIRLLNAEICY